MMKPKKNNVEKVNKNRFFIQRFLIIMFILGIGILIALMTINMVVKSTGEKIISVEKAAQIDADCILILGAGVNGDGTPSDMLEDRLKQGIALYNLGAADKLIMSGDHGRVDYDEVNVMKNYAIGMGYHQKTYLWIMPVFLLMRVSIEPEIFLV